ncbi:MAG TPA: diguanylate cyclase, partial [Leptolyngbya sp.]|nr:diguanylate cyclase [Leptolyngbya sp.]
MKQFFWFHDRLWLYAFLARFRWLRSYTRKILLIAFLGTHVPLLSLLFCFIFFTILPFHNKVQVMVIALVATLIGTGITLFALHSLLTPLSMTSLALRQYQRHQQLPDLPTAFRDEVGTLMADTSETLHKLDEVIRYMENYDDLTGLPNSSLFRELLRLVLLHASPSQLVAVLALRLDNLQDVTGTLGYHNGEQLLRTVAQHLSRGIHDDAVLGRGSSDEFWILKSVTTIEEVITLATTLLDSVSRPFLLDSNTIRTSASVGIALHPIDAVHVDVLLGNAGSAMAVAQRQAGNSYQWYSSELGAQLQERLRLEADLHHALERQELYLLYQPQVATNTGNLVGVEALIRWHHPTFGMVSPAQFIPIAETTGLIIAIGE